MNVAKANGRQMWRNSWRCRPRNWTDGSGGVSALRPLYLQQSLEVSQKNWWFCWELLPYC